MKRAFPGSAAISINEPCDVGADHSVFELMRRGESIDRAPRSHELPNATERFVRPVKEYKWSSLVDHTSVAEAAVVGKNDPISGQAIFAFVILKAGQEASDHLAVQLREHVAYVIGPIARPKFLMFVPDLPKTRSGKIMRRLLRDIAENRELCDVTTLTDSSVMNLIKERLPSAASED